MPRLTKFRCDRNLKEWSRFRHAKYIHGGLGNLAKKGNKKWRRPLIALEDLNHSGFNLFDPISTTINQAAPLKVSKIELFPLVQTNCLLSRNFTRNYPNYSQLSNKSTVGNKRTTTQKFLFQAVVPLK